MDLTSSKWRFKIEGERFTVKLTYKKESFIYRIWQGKEQIFDEMIAVESSQMFDPRTIDVETKYGMLSVTIGAVGMFKMACRVYLDGEEIYRSSKKDFHISDKVRDLFVEGDDENKNPEQATKLERAKARQPAIFVDFAMGIIFFFVAKKFGLVTAAVAGAGVTVLLFIIQRFVKKIDLLGGFAVFGVIMALISAGLAVAFQDDTFVKLRGSLMGLIAATVFFIDAIFGGKYMGKRMAGYFEMLFPLNPRRASFALAISGLLIIATDLPLVFLLTTDQWIWYNAFLDGFVAMPIVLTSLWFARERKSPDAKAQ